MKRQPKGHSWIKFPPGPKGTAGYWKCGTCGCEHHGPNRKPARGWDEDCDELLVESILES